MGHWRKIFPEQLEDITARNNHFLSPTWRLVELRTTQGDAVFEKAYLDLLESRKKSDNKALQKLLNSEQSLHLACYCGEGSFCHRHVALNWLKQQAKEQNIEVEILFQK